MNLATEFYKLPLRFDPARLAEEVRQFQGEDWRRHPQGHAGNSAVSLISLHGDHTNDQVRGPMRPTKHLERCPYLQQVLATFNSPMGRTRLMRIEGDADATAHIDTNYYWHHHVRIHVPVITYPEVTYMCGGKKVHMAAGECWIFNTWRLHNSINENPEPRVHLVADTVGSAWLWDVIENAEKPFAGSAGQASSGTHGQASSTPLRVVPFDPNARANVAFESTAYPVVMSPFEMEHLFNWIFGEIAQTEDGRNPEVAQLRAGALKLQRDWHALWAQYGPAPDGWPAFQQRLKIFETGIAPYRERFRLPNNIDLHEILMQAIVRAAFNKELASFPPYNVSAVPASGGAPAENRSAGVSPASAVGIAPTNAGAGVATPRPGSHRRRVEKFENPFTRPVFIVASPRSGSTLLFELLARAPGVFTVGGESHGVFERIPELNPANRNWDSNRLGENDASNEVASILVDRFLTNIHDRNQKPPPFGGGIRLLEKTPKNSLRIPFLKTVFPDAQFIYLYREPHENISSIMEAWKSGKFVTYPELPGWNHPQKWSLFLIPGWRELAGKPLEEIALAQWRAANQTIMDEMEKLPPERWTAVSYTEILQSPQAVAERLCKFAGWEWDQKLDGPLPNSRHTLTAPDPDKWKKNAGALEKVLPMTKALVTRSHDILAKHGSAVATNVQTASKSGSSEAVQVSWQPIGGEPSKTAAAVEAAAQPVNPQVSAQESPMAQAPANPQGGANQPLRSVHTTSLVPLLQQLGTSFLVSTYQAGKLIIVRTMDGGLNTHFRNFQSPMGMACDGQRLAIGTSLHVWDFRNQPDVGKKLEPVGRHDASFLPRNVHFTGDIRIHEIGYAGRELWIVNTRFSCLCTLDGNHSFVPRWRPKFITGLSPEDRCHLNGMAIIDGRPRYVTALGQTDTNAGWRENKASGGILMHVESNEIIASGLSMPHSPRWYQDKLWVLESGKGHLSTVDQRTGKLTMVAELPGFTRGLDFVGPYAFVGLSQIRESNIFGGLPLTQRLTERICGVWVVDIRSGQIVGFLRFEGAVQEIFAVQALQGVKFPDIINDDDKVLANSFVLPNEALAEVQFAK
ncbi:MAG TPA: TIGR03032 family protein, partial [Planctomycetota bacterium]|nr:TIGR03032 family protein [Planctomycetota bacterium]